MNCTTQTRKPRPQARRRMPNAEVLLPLPCPVLTITKPLLIFFLSVLILLTRIPDSLRVVTPIEKTEHPSARSRSQRATPGEPERYAPAHLQSAKQMHRRECSEGSRADNPRPTRSARYAAQSAPQSQ